MDKMSICDREYSESKSCINCENVKFVCYPIEEQYTNQFQPFTKKQHTILKPINTKKSLFLSPLENNIYKNIIFLPPSSTCKINKIPSPKKQHPSSPLTREKFLYE